MVNSYEVSTKLLTPTVRRAIARGQDPTGSRLLRARQVVRSGRVNAREDAGVAFVEGGSGTGRLAMQRLGAAIDAFMAAHKVSG